MNRAIALGLVMLAIAGCSTGPRPSWKDPTDKRNFEDQIDDCAASAREGWQEWGARKACEGRVAAAAWPMFERKFRENIRLRDGEPRGVDCDRGIRAVCSGYLEAHRNLIFSACKYSVLYAGRPLTCPDWIVNAREQRR